MEAIVQSLKDIYTAYGYTQYRMSKFEEYDLFARNKDFLVSDRVITFTDVNGKLLALKPDVTLSIVKNCRCEAGVEKVYYNENVYRVTRGAEGFRELNQVGLECIGQVDDYAIREVLTLACKSLAAISQQSVLSISHLALITDMLTQQGIAPRQQEKLLGFIGQKNAHELMSFCLELGITEDAVSKLTGLIALSGAPAAVLPQARKLLEDTPALAQLERLTEGLPVQIDFSVVDDIRYYNGIVFKGFVAGLPEMVLSGGQYDKLPEKLRKNARAIGFAVYTDALQMLQSLPETDVAQVLLYPENATIQQVEAAAEQLRQNGSVLVCRELPTELRYEKCYRLVDGEVVSCE